MDKFSLKPAELSSRIASIAKDIIAEEKRYNEAISENLSTERLQNIKERINFFKRKYSLYKQAAEMRLNNQ